MKNIFLLPTDEPSRLWFDNLSHKLVLSEMKTLVGYKASRNVYITNDEEVNIGDYVIVSCSEEDIEEVRVVKGYYNEHFLFEGKSQIHMVHCKKIILTTDYDLIVEGIQAVDNHFLKWFINNQNCEFIHAYNDRVVGYPYDNYTIIIPGERKPWRFCETPKEKCTMNYCDENGCQNRKRNLTNPTEETGAKLQQEIVYSKQDVNHLEWMYNRMIEIHNENPNYDYMIKFKEIINQFKNK